MGLDVSARYFIRIQSIETLAEALVFAREKALPVFVLGGGSNVILHENVNGVCLHVAIDGYEQQGTTVQIGAGENWQGVVTRSLQSGLSGLENLSLIPGQAGAAPIQNIGAYGVELSSRLQSLKFMDIHSGEIQDLSAAECQFGYRNSIFKNELKDQTVIISINLLLDDKFHPHLAYSGIEAYLDEHRLPLSAVSVGQAVCAIRRSKLPNPAEFGNVGSFFQNPVVSANVWLQLHASDNNMPGHLDENGSWKLSAAYLIDKAGLKGRRVGGAMVSSQHALVIQNNGNASGSDVLQLASEIQETVQTRFGITLDIEPRLVPA